MAARFSHRGVGDSRKNFSSMHPELSFPRVSRPEPRPGGSLNSSTHRGLVLELMTIYAKNSGVVMADNCDHNTGFPHATDFIFVTVSSVRLTDDLASGGSKLVFSEAVTWRRGVSIWAFATLQLLWILADEYNIDWCDSLAFRDDLIVKLFTSHIELLQMLCRGALYLLHE